MLALCECGVYRIETEHATYVRDGKPLCHAETCRKVRYYRQATRVPLASSEETDHAAG